LRRAIIAAIIAITIIFMGICSIWMKSRSFPALIKQAVVSELSRSLDTAVFIGDVHFRGPFSIQLENVAIAGRNAESGTEPFLQSDEVDVTLNLLRYLLSGGKPVDIIKGLHIRQPQVRLAQVSDGGWNIPLPVSGSGCGGRWPDMEITLHNGTLAVDAAGRDSILPDRMTVNLDNGILNLNKKDLSFNVTAGVLGADRNNRNRMVLKGGYGTAGGRLQMQFEELQTDIWRRMLSRFTSADIISGSLSGYINAEHKSNAWILNNASVNLSDARIVPYKDAAEIIVRQAKLRLDDKNIYLPRTALQWLGETAYLSGNIEDYRHARKLNLKIDADQTNLARLAATVMQGDLPGIKGRGTVGIRVSGSLSSPRLFGSIQSDGISYNKERLQDVKAEFVCLNGGRYLLSGEACYLDAPISGRLTGKNGRLLYAGQVDNLEAGRIPALAQAGLAGIGRVSLDFQGRSGHEDYLLQGKFSGGSGNIKGFGYKSVTGRFSSNGNGINLQEMKFGTEFGTLEAKAIIHKGRFNISLHGSDLKPGGILPPQFKGIKADMKADIEGPSSQGGMKLAARFNFSEAVYGVNTLYLAFPQTSSSEICERNSLHLAFSQLSSSEESSQPVLRAVVSGRELTYHNVPLDKLEADLIYSEGRLRIPSLLVKQAAGDLTATEISVPVAVKNGRISFGGPVAGKINASLADMTAWGWKRLADFSGPLKIHGSLSGSVENPVLSGNIALPEGYLNLQGLDISALICNFTADRDKIAIADLRGKIGHFGGGSSIASYIIGNFSGGGNITLQNWQLDKLHGRLALTDGRLESLAGLSAPYFKNISGAFAADICIDGKVSAPDITGDICLADAGGYFGSLKTPLAGVNGQLHLSGNQLEIAGLEGMMDKGTFNISGDVELDGIKPAFLKLAVGSNNARINYSPYFNGLVDSELLISGPVAEPLIEGSIGINNSRVSLAGLNGADKSFFRPELNIKGTMGHGVEIILSKISAPVKGTLEISGTLEAPRLEPRNMVADFGLFKIPIKNISL
jgi:hypothetical protein